MRVFISWSGERSHDVALALRDWLPKVLQAVDPWVSSEDIDKGARWNLEIALLLDETDFGIVCLTAESQSSAWLNFESGALAKRLAAGRVATFLLGLKSVDVTGPLAQFQHTAPTESDMIKLIRALNKFSQVPISDGLVVESVATWWPSLNAQISQALASGPAEDAGPPERSDRQLLEELLESVREIRRESAETPSSGGSAGAAYGEVGPMKSALQSASELLAAHDRVDTSPGAVKEAEALAADAGWNLGLAVSWCEDLWYTQNGRILHQVPIDNGGYATADQMRIAAGRELNSPYGLTGFTGGVSKRFNSWASQRGDASDLEMPVETKYSVDVPGRQRARGFEVAPEVVPLFAIALELTKAE